MVVPPLFELLFSQKTILQQRGRRLLIPHTPEMSITHNRMALGIWQGIYLFEHRVCPHTRDVLLHLLGE
jgi:thiamine phosphate synthase YjbQ (UPF0047 family)